MISNYYVGDIPITPLLFSVRNQENGPFNLQGSVVRARMIDPKDREVDLTGSEVVDAGAVGGFFRFYFPSDRSVFTQEGDYMIQLLVERTDVGPDSNEPGVQATSPHVIRVKKLGKVVR